MTSPEVATILRLCSRIMQSGNVTQSTVIRALETAPEGMALMKCGNGLATLTKKKLADRVRCEVRKIRKKNIIVISDLV